MVATIRPNRRLPWFSTVTQKRAWDVGSPVKRTRGVKVAFVSSRSGRGGGVLPAPSTAAVADTASPAAAIAATTIRIPRTRR